MKIFTLFILLLSQLFANQEKGDLFVEINNVQSTSGVIWVGLYDSSETFLDKEKAILTRVEINQTGTVSLWIPDLYYGGDYAIAVLHDLNNNGDLDRNFFGIPTEPFAFSGHIYSSWRAPRFEEVKFRFDSSHNSLQLSLKEWWDF